MNDYSFVSTKGKLVFHRIAYGSVRDPPLYYGLCLRMHRDLTRTINHAITDDGLRVDGQRRRSFVGLDCNSSRHGDCDYD